MRKTVFYSIVIAGLAVFSCVPVELDNIEAFVYTFPELEEVEPLPEPELTAPPEVTETDGDIVITEETEELVTNVEEAVANDNLTEENLALIDDFAEVGEEVSDEEVIETVTDEWIEGVLDETVTPSQEFEAIADEFESNPEFEDYLSQLDLPAVDGTVPGGRMIFGTIDLEKFTPVRQVEKVQSLVTPCKEAAEAIYLRNLGTLEDQVAAQRAQAKTYYDGLAAQADALYATRLAQRTAILNARLQSLRTYLVNFNRLVDRLRYPARVKRGLKIYAAAYTIRVSRQLFQWADAYARAAVFARDKRKSETAREYAAALARIESAFTQAKNSLTASYNTAVNNCHNQGSGG